MVPDQEHGSRIGMYMLLGFVVAIAACAHCVLVEMRLVCSLTEHFSDCVL